MTEYQWKDVSVVGFDELMQALDRADRKGYMPDAIKDEWEAFNWKPAPVAEPHKQQEPVAWMHPDGRIWTFGRGLDKSTFTIPLYTSPPAAPASQEEIQRLSALVRAQQITIEKLESQRQWVGLTDEDTRKINQEVWGYVSADHTRMWDYARALEAKLRERNEHREKNA